MLTIQKVKKILIMEKTNKKRSLMILLIVELATLVLGLEFFNPFPFSEISEDHATILMTFILFGLSYAYGIIAFEISGIMNTNKYMGYFVLACLFLAFLSPIWPILLGAVIIFTIVLLITTNSKSSVS